jgi:Bestrophin, RFP-TM, chloride channel
MILLPFQFCQLFGWVTVPASMVTGCILFGLLHISYEIENPFGYDINDLDLDRYCRGLAIDLDLICSYMPYPDPKEWLYSTENRPLWPLQGTVSFNGTEKMGLDSVKVRLDDRRKRCMELWKKGLENVEEERSKKKFWNKGDTNATTIRERGVSPSSEDTMV